MDCRRRLVLRAMIASLPLLAASVPILGDDYSPRQYYGPWQPSPTSTYYYRSYYYKPTPSYAGYKHHYVVAYPSDSKHYYYYNPYKKTYWGRCDSYCDGQAYYSRLPDEYQRPTLAEIPDGAFPANGPLPSIPESSDGGHLDLPPDDAPPGPVAPQSGGGANPPPPIPAPPGPASPSPGAAPKG
jgi:hypothetical protein